MNKQVFVAFLALAIAVSAYAACTDREKDSDESLLDDIKCTLTSAKDKASEGISSVISSDTVQNSYSYVKNKTSSAADTIGDAAKKTGSFLSDGFSSLWDKTKSGFNSAKEAIQGKKADSQDPAIDVTNLNLPTVAP